MSKGFKMTDSYKVLYEPMPETVGSLQGSDSTLARDSELKSFVADHLSRSEKTEIEAEFKKTFPLHRQRVGKIKKPQPR